MAQNLSYEQEKTKHQCTLVSGLCYLTNLHTIQQHRGGLKVISTHENSEIGFNPGILLLSTIFFHITNNIFFQSPSSSLANNTTSVSGFSCSQTANATQARSQLSRVRHRNHIRFLIQFLHKVVKTCLNPRACA